MVGRWDGRAAAFTISIHHIYTSKDLYKRVRNPRPSSQPSHVHLGWPSMHNAGEGAENKKNMFVNTLTVANDGDV